MSTTVLSLLIDAGRLPAPEVLLLKDRAAARGLHPLLLAFEQYGLSWDEVVRIVGAHNRSSRLEFRPGLADDALLARLDRSVLRRCAAVPMEQRRDGVVVFAVGDPVDETLHRQLTELVGGPIDLHWADPARLGAFLETLPAVGPAAPPPPAVPAPGADRKSAAEEGDEDDAEELAGASTAAPAAAPEPEPAPEPAAAPTSAPPRPAGPPRPAAPSAVPPPARRKRAAMAAAPAANEAEVAAPPARASRRTTVNYYKKMSLASNYPLSVVISEGKVVVRGPRGSITAEGRTWSVAADDTSVDLVPCFPGCLIVPARQTVDVSAPQVEASFFVTPLALGRLPDAAVQVWQRGRCIDRLATPSRVTRQTLTRISGVLSVLVGISMALARFRESSFSRPFYDNLPALNGFSDRMEDWGSAVGGVSNLGLIVTGVLTLITGCFYLDRRPAMADPVEGTLGGED